MFQGMYHVRLGSTNKGTHARFTYITWNKKFNGTLRTMKIKISAMQVDRKENST